MILIIIPEKIKEIVTNMYAMILDIIRKVSSALVILLFIFPYKIISF